MVFIIKPLGGQLAEDQDFLGKADPYCVIIIGDKKFQSKPHSGGGKAPQWTDSFKFEGNALELKVQVYDDDIGKDDYYGEGFMSLAMYMANPGKPNTEYVEIFNKNKKAGQVAISVEYQGPAVQNAASFNNPSKLGY